VPSVPAPQEGERAAFEEQSLIHVASVAKKAGVANAAPLFASRLTILLFAGARLRYDVVIV